VGFGTALQWCGAGELSKEEDTRISKPKSTGKGQQTGNVAIRAGRYGIIAVTPVT
jgi:hypothetical protein